MLHTKKYIGLQILIVGTLISFMGPFLPSTLTYPTILFYWASFAGFLYVYFTPSIPYRTTILVSFSVLILARALQAGMFTVVAYMGITIFSFLFLGRHYAFWKKMLVFLLAVFFLFIVQSVKSAYRQYTWGQNYSGSKSLLFGSLIAERVTNTNALLSEKALFPIYSRTNQGWNIALVMKKFPKSQDFDHGDRLMLVAASSFVPRFLWTDKPEAGGKFNMQYYANYTISGWSTNVGPLGEAYGSFGRGGGIIYMFILGFLIRLAYQQVFLISRKSLFIMFWLPLLFYEIAFSMETDTLSILNSLIKGSVFLYILYKIVPRWFGAMKTKKKQVASKHVPGIVQQGFPSLSHEPGS